MYLYQFVQACVKAGDDINFLHCGDKNILFVVNITIKQRSALTCVMTFTTFECLV